MNEIQEQIKVVAQVRKLAQEKADAVKASKLAWEKSNRNFLEDAEQTAQFLSASEMVLRDLTLKAYLETGNKTPAPCVGIREVNKLEYDLPTAFEWAIEHRMALKLDTPAFEKIAKASPPGFVKTVTAPQATIATDLNQYLTNS